MTLTTTTAGLTPAQRDDLARRLTTRQAELDRQIAQRQQGESRVAHAHSVLDQDGDDAPQRDSDRTIDLTLTDLEMAELTRVGTALRRLARPDFGQCSACGEPIALARLQAEPWAERCVDCESARERADHAVTGRRTL